MRKIPARYIREADNVIKVMKAFKRGQPIQKRGKFSTDNKWVDFDFVAHINTPRIHYRVKPKNKKNDN